jgi:hypothetical protein
MFSMSLRWALRGETEIIGYFLNRVMYESSHLLTRSTSGSPNLTFSGIPRESSGFATALR